MLSVFLTQYNGMILGPVAKLLGMILNAIFEFLSIFNIENAGLCIILFTFIVRTLMIPMTIKQQKFSKLNSVMAPELTAVQNKYKGKKDEVSMRKQQLEIQAVYQKYGGSPASGCLPMLITFPIMLALYRVIYNIPAYVHDIYALYQPIAEGISNTGGYAGIMAEYAKNLKVMTNGWGDITKEIPINHLIDIMVNFQKDTWGQLVKDFPALTDVIQTNSSQIISINSFFGTLNIANRPGYSWPGIMIPILAMVFQFIAGKQMELQSPVDGGNPAAASMKTMNIVMPIMSGFFCVTLPIGVGLYWISGSVFQIIQQFFIDRYFKKIDVEDLIAKNQEKAKKKKQKRGIDSGKSMEDFANMQTKSLSEKAVVQSKKDTANDKNTNIGKEKAYKSGSIAEKAHLLDRNKGDK